MSLLRRRMMMQTAKSGAKYPLVNGRHEFNSGAYIEVTNGNHVKFHAINAGFINVSNVFQNTANQSSVDNVKCPLWFSVNNGDVGNLKIFNLQKEGTSNANIRFVKENSSNTAFGTIINLIEDVEKEFVVAETEGVGCLYCFCYGTMTVEFDVEFTVNGERWI